MTYRCGHSSEATPRYSAYLVGKEHVHFTESGLCPECFDRKAMASFRAAFNEEPGCPYCGHVVCTCTHRDCKSLLPKDELELTRSGY